MVEMPHAKIENAKKFIYMKKYTLLPLLVLTLFCGTLCAQNSKDASMLEIFNDRKKCTVMVEYIIQAEENREKISVQAVVADDKGTLILPAESIPEILPPKMLKDFKVYVPEYPDSGEKCFYLGCDKLYKFHFVRTQSGAAPKGTKPFTEFKPAQFELTQPIWGVIIMKEYFSFDTAYARSYVSYINKGPYDVALTADMVSGIGGPVFNMDGNFVGIASGNAVDLKTLLLPDGKSIPIALRDDWCSNSVIAERHVKEALKLIPKNPSGDAVASLGITDSRPIKREVAKFLGLKEDESGIVIGDIVKGSAAEKAGLKKGDLIVGFDSHRYKVTKQEYAVSAIFSFDILRKAPGDKAVLSVIKSGESEIKNVEVVFDKSPKTIAQAQTQYFKRLGFSIREFVFDDACARRILKYDETGAVVRWVKPNSPAASAMPKNVYAGGRIKKINSTQVNSYDEAVKLLEKIETDKSAKELVLVLEDINETSVSRIKLD